MHQFWSITKLNRAVGVVYRCVERTCERICGTSQSLSDKQAAETSQCCSVSSVPRDAGRRRTVSFTTQWLSLCLCQYSVIFCRSVFVTTQWMASRITINHQFTPSSHNLKLTFSLISSSRKPFTWRKLKLTFLCNLQHDLLPGKPRFQIELWVSVFPRNRYHREIPVTKFTSWPS